MNTVFHSLKAEFNATETYDGDDIHSTVLNTIKVRPLLIELIIVTQHICLYSMPCRLHMVIHNPI